MVTLITVIITRKVDSRHARINLAGNDIVVCLLEGQLLLTYYYGIGVEVSHIHIIGAEVGRSTQHTVGGSDSRRHILMGTATGVSIVQGLSEEQVVVGPYGIVVRSLCSGIDIESLVGTARNCTCGIDEVAIGKAVLDVALVPGNST